MTPAPARPIAAPFADTAQAILAVSRLVGAGGAHGDLQPVRDAIVAESRLLLGVRWAALIAFKDGGKRAIAVGGDARGGVQLADHPPLAELATGPRRTLHVGAPGEASELVSGLIATRARAGCALALRLPLSTHDHVLILADPHPGAFPSEAIAAAEALVEAGVAALSRGVAADVDARRATRLNALTSAAKTLNESLDLATVLTRICEEATRILDADYVSVYQGTPDGLVLNTGSGMAGELVGLTLRPGEGLASKVFKSGRAMLTNDYSRISNLPADSPFGQVRSAMAVPMRWGGDLRGVIGVGYLRSHEVTPEQLALLETFAELAAVACTNASAHAGVALAARTDGLTGCLNHAALHDSLQREIERAERSEGRTLSLVMLDLDDFKSVNEVHGHLVGDEVLRRAGFALRDITRPYDFAARYGGDEFAVLSIEADEDETGLIASRAVDHVSLAIGELCPGTGSRVTAGVAEWSSGLLPAELIARADRALLFGKHQSGRGSVVASSSVPGWFRPARFASRTVEPTGAPPVRIPAPLAGVDPVWPSQPSATGAESLHRRTRQLGRLGALAGRLTAPGGVEDILALAVDELTWSLDAAECAVLRLTHDGGLELAAGIASHESELAGMCVHEGRSLIVSGPDTGERLAVALRVARQDWGVIELRAAGAKRFDDDDLRLAQAIADCAGAALLVARRHAELERSLAQAVAALRAARTPEADAGIAG